MDTANPTTLSVFDSLRQRLSLPLIEHQMAIKPAKVRWTDKMTAALKTHWPEYTMEALELGLFMLSACVFTVLLYHPVSPVVQSIPDEPMRRVLMGSAMGLTAIAIIFSPFGKRSGAHFNPAVTLTFLRLGKVNSNDAAFYILFQFVGGIAGVTLAWLLLGPLVAHQAVRYAPTVPGPHGPLPAFLAELTISFIQMSVILRVSNSKRIARWTGVFAGLLVATYITIESPISGMSMNPARTLGSAAWAQLWTALWIYFTAPPIGMLLAAEVYRRSRANRKVLCAKLHHHNNKSCIFRCNFGEE